LGRRLRRRDEIACLFLEHFPQSGKRNAERVAARRTETPDKSLFIEGTHLIE
jgi:hypothetical protein